MEREREKHAKRHREDNSVTKGISIRENAREYGSFDRDTNPLSPYIDFIMCYKMNKESYIGVSIEIEEVDADVLMNVLLAIEPVNIVMGPMKIRVKDRIQCENTVILMGKTDEEIQRKIDNKKATVSKMTGTTEEMATKIIITMQMIKKILSTYNYMNIDVDRKYMKEFHVLMLRRCYLYHCLGVLVAGSRTSRQYDGNGIPFHGSFFMNRNCTQGPSMENELIAVYISNKKDTKMNTIASIRDNRNESEKKEFGIDKPIFYIGMYNDSMWKRYGKQLFEGTSGDSKNRDMFFVHMNKKSCRDLGDFDMSCIIDSYPLISLSNQFTAFISHEDLIERLTFAMNKEGSDWNTFLMPPALYRRTNDVHLVEVPKKTDVMWSYDTYNLDEKEKLDKIWRKSALGIIMEDKQTRTSELISLISNPIGMTPHWLHGFWPDYFNKRLWIDLSVHGGISLLTYTEYLFKVLLTQKEQQ